jgi:hypothetical protein
MMEDFLTEIYFEDSNWYLLFNEETFYWFEINSIHDLEIYTNDGVLMIKEDYQPTYVSNLLLITNDDLVQPVTINPTAGTIWVEAEGQYWLTQQITWGESSGSDVGPLLAGQSINYLPFSYSQSQNMWIPIKNSSPYYYNGYWNGSWEGTFQGYLSDQNGNPVENAEIKYVSDLMLYPLGSFTPLVTTTGGFFQESLYAKIYQLSKVVKDGNEYEIDYWLNMEPGMTITMDLVVDLTVGVAEIANLYHVTLNNFPNPFSHQTTIELKIDIETHFNTGIMMISNLSGSVVSVIPFNRAKFEHNVLKYEWMNDSSLDLPNGQYIIKVEMDGKQVAQSKMIISK